MKNLSYLSYILIASFAFGLFSDQANSQKMSKEEIAKRVPDFQYGWSLYKVLNTEPITFQTDKSFDEMQLCFASVMPSHSPNSFAYDQNEKYTIWSMEGYRLLLRYTQLNSNKNVELYGIDLRKKSSLKKIINRIAICTGNSSIDSDS
jgi:hypothetical protein